MEGLDAAVREALAEAQSSGATITARQVRAACERRLGLPPDGLLEKKEQVMALITAVLESGGGGGGGGGGGSSTSDGTGSNVDPEAVRTAIAALEDPDSGPTRAALLVAELTGASDPNVAAEAMALLSEVCAGSELASSRLVEAKGANALALFVSPSAPKTACSLAVRMLSAMALHKSVTGKLVGSAALAPLLARLSISIDGAVGIQCAALLHNLADSPANRMRLLHAGALEVVTRLMVEPSASGSLKEHLLTAAHSLLGASDEALALPDILGRFLAAKLPGTQKSALASVQIIREQRPGVEERLAGCQPLVDGLGTAKGSSDAAVASGAAEILAALDKYRK
jgi:hypothetical protein